MNRCLKIADDIILKAKETCQEGYVFNNESYNILKSYIEIIDEILDENDAESCYVGVDKYNRIVIEFECNIIEFCENKIDVADILLRTCNYSITNENNLIKMTVVFPSLWEKVNNEQ